MSKRKIDAADVEGDRWGVDEAAQAEADVEADRSDLFERRRLMDELVGAAAAWVGDKGRTLTDRRRPPANRPRTRTGAKNRRDRLLLISALAIAVLSLLGAAGERIGYDRWLKANTVKRRTHSLFRQGLMLYHHLPNWPEDRTLMETFGSMLMEQRVYREVFGVI